MARISNFGKIDTLSISGELTVPLVILTKEKLGKTTYVGFVPALTKKDIVWINNIFKIWNLCSKSFFYI